MRVVCREPMLQTSGKHQHHAQFICRPVGEPRTQNSMSPGWADLRTSLK